MRLTLQIVKCIEVSKMFDGIAHSLIKHWQTFDKYGISEVKAVSRHEETDGELLRILGRPLDMLLVEKFEDLQ